MSAVRFSPGTVRRRQRTALAARLAVGLAVALLPWLVAAPGASAIILPAKTIDGPSEDIVGFGGAAMAEDGSGGLVYLKRVGGVAHVFVSRYAGGSWQAPTQVDVEQPFAASWARIGAAEGGELIVVWATPFATEHGHLVYELLGAELGPGSRTFGAPVIVDPNIGDGTGTSPDLAVSSTGQADVVYRVVSFSSSVPLLRPTDVVESVRVASFDGERWNSLGTVNRDPGLSMRPPTEANAPQIAIGPTGNGIVVWQEPEASGVARIWARRIFGQSLNYVMPVTATSFNGTPIGIDADAPAAAISKLGQAEVAYRQPWATGSPLPGPRIFLNTLSDGESESGAEFLGAAIADPGVGGGRGALIGRPSVDIDERRQTAPALRRQRPAAGRGTQRPGRARAVEPRLCRSAARCSGRSGTGLRVGDQPAGGRGLGVAQQRPAGTPRRGRARGLPGAAPSRPRSSAAAQAGRSAKSPSGAPVSATGSSPSNRVRSATPRSSPRR